jgi:spore germination protein YaaH
MFVASQITFAANPQEKSTPKKLAPTHTQTATAKKAPIPKLAKPQQDTFSVAVWIPYWRKEEGASSTLTHLNSLHEISPFAYELQNDGTIKNSLNVEDEPWNTLITEAKKKHIAIYPSILSYPHSEQEKLVLHKLLANKQSRAQHIKDILALLANSPYDGIDIDYEAKLAETKPYFSLFLTELAKVLHNENKKLVCTIEPRTPPESRYATTSQSVLAKVEYANDYKVIGKVCDIVRVMTYDQIGDDLALVNQNRAMGKLYRPVADIDWVEKVASLMMWDIPANKIVLGVATYGYKYEIVNPNTKNPTYKRIGSMNFIYADELARTINVKPSRNIAGELSFVYSTTTATDGTPLGSEKTYLVWYSDSVAIADKMRLAKLYKLRGIAIFKIDGGFDPNLWNILPVK